MTDALRVVAAEFGIGDVVDASHLAGGGPDVTRLHTSRGAYVVKRPWNLLDVELYSTVERTLNERGIRQARQLRTTTGGLVASTGHAVQELLPGAITDEPSRTQTTNTMTQLALYDRALASVEVPPELDARDSVWTRVVRPDYLLGRLPRLIAERGPDWLDPKPVEELLDALVATAPALAALPRQLVHGDLGPDNVLYEGEDVVALIDFTPYHDSVLLGLASAVYFFHVHGRSACHGEIEASFATYGADVSLAWAALVREALRRLATPFAVAETGGTPLAEGMTLRRYESAVRLTALLGSR